MFRRLALAAALLCAALPAHAQQIPLRAVGHFSQNTKQISRHS